MNIAALPIEQWEGLRVLTVREPWATLIVTGFKDIENRSRRFGHRGPLLIHTSASVSRCEYDDVCRIITDRIPAAARPEVLPTWEESRKTFGKIIGGCVLKECHPYDYKSRQFFKMLSIGNTPWVDGSPFALELGEAWKALEPVAFKGQLCLGTFRKAVTP